MHCDDTISPVNTFSESPDVKQLTVSPDEVTFTLADGFKDTSVTIQIDATIENVNDDTFIGYSITDRGNQELLISNELVSGNTVNTYSSEIELETTTTSFLDLLIEVFAYTEDGKGNYIQKSLGITGFSNNPPEILEVSNPDTLTRPVSGDIPAIFTATVTDLDGDDTISRVLIRIIDSEDGEVTGSPFDMADDGNSLRDETANDNIFTWSLNVPSNPASGRINRDYDIEYFAIDKGGLYSDTLRTTFSIRGSE